MKVWGEPDKKKDIPTYEPVNEIPLEEFPKEEGLEYIFGDEKTIQSKRKKDKKESGILSFLLLLIPMIIFSFLILNITVNNNDTTSKPVMYTIQIYNEEKILIGESEETKGFLTGNNLAYENETGILIPNYETTKWHEIFFLNDIDINTNEQFTVQLIKHD